MSQRFPNPNHPIVTPGGEEPRINLWRLPRLVSVAARRVTYPQPRVYYVGSERRETRQAVELRIETSEPIPVRAVTPILMIGETAIADYSTEGATTYRFVAYEPERLEPGAPIRWGWPGPPEAPVATRFRFSLGSSPRPVASAGGATRARRGGTGFREDLAEQVPRARFRTVFYDEDTLRFIEGWTRAAGSDGVFLINRATFDPIRDEGRRRGREYDRFLAQAVSAAGRGRMDLMPPLYVIDASLHTAPLAPRSPGDWDDLMISQLIAAGRRLAIQSQADQWSLINRLFAKAKDDARQAAQQQRAAREFVAYFVLDTINATLGMVEATNITMQNGHAVIPIGRRRDTGQLVLPGGDAAQRVIGDIHTHFLFDPLINLNRSSLGTTIRSTTTSLHSGVSDVDTDSARDNRMIVYAVDSKYLHRANPDGTKPDDKLPRKGDVLREALRVFGGEPGPSPSG